MVLKSSRKGAEIDTIQEYFSEMAKERKKETSGSATAAIRQLV